MQWKDTSNNEWFHQVLEKERKRSRNAQGDVASDDEEENEAPETPRQQRKRCFFCLIYE